MIKFKNKDNDAISNEISFVPHLIETKAVNVRLQDENGDEDRTSDNVDELTTVIIDTGNKFAYDTVINNNEESFFAGSNATNLGGEKSNNRARSNEVVEQSSTTTFTNIINKNNEKQESTIKNLNNAFISQLEGSSRTHIGNTADVDTKTKNHSNINGNFELTTQSIESSIGSKKDAEISASIANNTSTTERSFNDFEIKRFISEHMKYKANNITIKKSWGKWSSWSACSRSCGEGVMGQSRECNEKK